MTSFSQEAFDDPQGIAVDHGGVVYVCDCGNNILQLYLKISFFNRP